MYFLYHGKQVTSRILLLMAIIQPTEHKVRPVLDFRELNEYVACTMGNNIIDMWRDNVKVKANNECFYDDKSEISIPSTTHSKEAVRIPVKKVQGEQPLLDKIGL